MNLNDLQMLLHILCCPQCNNGSLSITNHVPPEMVCSSCGGCYPISHGRPVLFRADNDLFCVDDYRNIKPFASTSSGLSWEKLIPSPSLNMANRRVLSSLKSSLDDFLLAIVLVVGGGSQRKWLDEHLGAGDKIRVIYSDIDVQADVDMFCDGHNLPFVDGSFDAVVTTAVLEHVLYPEVVADEISRVLKAGGLLYSEMPFMQQVHEGAYDFTRYTHSGHRRLFNSFAVLESGMVAGAGTALVWAIENFILSFIVRKPMRKIAKALVRLFFWWLKYFDLLLVNRPEAMDGASCTYLFGRRIEGKVSDSDIITGYVGAKHLSHK